MIGRWKKYRIVSALAIALKQYFKTDGRISNDTFDENIAINASVEAH